MRIVMCVVVRTYNKMGRIVDLSGYEPFIYIYIEVCH